MLSRWMNHPAVCVGALVVALLLATFTGPLLLDYGRMDDYCFLWASNYQPELITEHDVERGRFLAAHLHQFAYAQVWTIAELRWVRLASLAAFCVFALGWIYTLRVAGWPVAMAGAVAVLICTMPSAQSSMSLATSIHRPFAGVVALVAAHVLYRGLLSDRVRPGALAWLIGAALLLAALTLQQSWAMFIVPALAVLFSAAPPGPQRIARSAAYAGSAICAALGASAVLMRSSIGSIERTTLVRDLDGKLLWFLREPLLNAASPFLLEGSPLLAIGLAMLVLFGLIATLRRVPSARPIRCLLLAGLLALPLTYLPNLLSAENYASYRSIGPLAALLIVLAAAALRVLLSARDGGTARADAALVVCAVFSCVLAQHNLGEYIAKPQAAERQLMLEGVSSLDLSRIDRIHVIQPNYENRPTHIWRYDDFGRPSSYAEWCVVPMYRLALQDIDPLRAEQLSRLPITVGPADVDFEDRAGVGVIDLRRIEEYRRAR